MGRTGGRRTNSGRKSKTQITAELEHEIISLYHRGFSQKEICERTNVTCYKQRVIYEKYGIVTRSRQEAMIIKREKQFAEAEEKKQQQLYCEDGRKAINCNKDGNRCKYHVNHNEYKCNYIGMVGHMRGCEPCMCTKWQPKERRKKNVAQDRCKQSEYVSETI